MRLGRKEEGELGGEREQRKWERDRHDQSSYPSPKAPQARGPPSHSPPLVRRDTRTPVLNREADKNCTIRKLGRDSYPAIVETHGRQVPA